MPLGGSRTGVVVLATLLGVLPTRADEFESTVVGRLNILPDAVALNGQSRPIRVWCPPGYDADTAARFDVLYMHDGQNCFDRKTSAFGKEWRIDETLTELIKQKKVRPLIVVAIDNGGGQRINELTFTRDPKHGGGSGEAYLNFLTDVVMPFVKQTYRTNTGPSHTIIGGASLGGLASLEIARRRPDLFGGAMVMSPSLWWAGGTAMNGVANDTGGLKKVRVWLDVGTREGDAEDQARSVANVKTLDNLLVIKDVEHRLAIDPLAVHDENAWAKRFPLAMQYLAPP